MERNACSSTNKDSRKNNRRIWFDWIQLIAAILVPIVIAVYTVVDNKSNESIANANRRSDLQIAEDQRLNEIQLGEQSRKEDRALNIDQQEENILLQYQTFLSRLIIEHGNYLQKSSEAKIVAQFMTLTALDQLNVNRKRILLRSLHHANLINFLKTEKSFNASIVNLDQADLSHIQFGLSSNRIDKLPMYRYIDWNYVWLPRTILVNASFRHTILDHTTFTESVMDSIDMGFATHTIHQSRTNFVGASLIKANMSNVRFRLTDFSFTNLLLSQMDNFECIECNFSHSILAKVNLNYSIISHTFYLSKDRLLFDYTNFSHALIHSASFKAINFTKSDWSNVQASQIGIYNSIFTNAIMDKSSLIKSTIQDSVFEDVNFYETDFSYAKFYNVTFINLNMHVVNMSFISCEYCFFINVNFEDMIWTHISLRYSKFRDCSIDTNELFENSIDIFESKLINGTNEYNLGKIDSFHRILYIIRIKTGNRIPIETHMNVYLTIFGQVNQTRETELKSNDYQLNRFQNGHINNFTYLFNNFGQIKSIMIRYYENTQKTKWFLDWIEVDIPIRDEFYKFTCFCWIEKSEVTNQYQIELKPSEIIQKNIFVTYEVTVYTGDARGVTVGAHVHLKIYGEYRNSDTYRLHESKTNSNSFQRNQKDIFHVNSLYLGKLNKIDVSLLDGLGSSSWFLLRIEIRDTRINNTYFEFDFQDNIRNRNGLHGEYPPSEILLSKYYIINDLTFFQISVITSDSLGSGTDANVYIIIFDSFKNTGKIPLKNSKTYKNPFEQGHRDEFHIELTEFDSPIKIKIGHDNSGFGTDWSLDRVEIERPSLNQKWIFPYGKKLTQLNEEKRIEIELYPETN
ncbi:unnamed protein product [Adineta steineri]|uniref:PLAT domain-containing protein n=1 Tax=Adineta steineri TaxID=433720 RepID=A0A813S5L7_9BILA|nr:unnamed protein product [Adineta steineri]CAF0821286.1 unnamed protein product [Adineta steineri]